MPISHDIIYLLDHEDHYFLGCWWTLWRCRQNINIYVLCCTAGWFHQELAAIYSRSCVFGCMMPGSSVLFALCSSIWLLNFTRNIATVKAVRRPGVAMATCIWHYQMSLSSRAHHIRNGLSFFPRQLRYSAGHFYIPTCLTALLFINQPLKRIKERLTAFGGQQTHVWPWHQSINGSPPSAIYAGASKQRAASGAALTYIY